MSKKLVGQKYDKESLSKIVDQIDVKKFWCDRIRRITYLTLLKQKQRNPYVLDSTAFYIEFE